MPTPRDSTDQLPLLLERSTHTTCPPEEDRPGQWRVEVLDRLGRAALDSALSDRALGQHDDVSVEAESPSTLDITIDPVHDKTSEQTTTMDLVEASLSGESPPSPHVEDKELERVQLYAPTSSALDLYYSTRFGIESNRVSIIELHYLKKRQANQGHPQLIQTHLSSMLRAGSKFRGTQQSDSQKYSVEVDIKTVDMCESFICGYLRIEGQFRPSQPCHFTEE